MKVFAVIYDDYESDGSHAGEFERNSRILAIRLTAEAAWDFVWSKYTREQLLSSEATFGVDVEEYDTDDDTPVKEDEDEDE